MNRSKQIRAVLVELEENLKSGLTTIELLECANLIVETVNGKERRLFGAMEPRKTFDELPLDVIFSDWQWRLLTREYRSEEQPVELYTDPNLIIDQLFQFQTSKVNIPY